MAVFGIPVSHEDDALRAVRAAAEMRAAIAEHGLEARIGDQHRRGRRRRRGRDARHRRRRQRRRASRAGGADGRVLIGAETRARPRRGPRRSGRAARAEGKSRAGRGLSAPRRARERRRSRATPRRRSSAASASASGSGATTRTRSPIARAGSSRSSARPGSASRASSPTSSSGSATRRTSCAVAASRTARASPTGRSSRSSIALGVEPGDASSASTPAETQLAFRQAAREPRRERPQVVVIDDLQWAEPVFVDLVEHVADLSRDAPIFLLCVARTELLDVRPTGAAGSSTRRRSCSSRSATHECDELIEHLLGEIQLDDGAARPHRRRLGGNPLFVEEMLAMVRESEGGGTSSSRRRSTRCCRRASTRSTSDVRVVIERAAVEGEVFHRGAVAELVAGSVRTDARRASRERSSARS